MRKIYAIVALLALGAVISWNPVQAVITAKTPLKAIHGSSLYIVLGKVEKYYADKPAMLVTATADLKGKAPFRRLPINCKIDDPKAFKDNQIEPLLKRFGPGIDIVFFVTQVEKDYVIYAFTEGTWFQLLGTTVGKPEEVVFSLKSAEPFFRKTYKGSTEAMVKLLKDHAAGKAKLPPLDDKVPPGFGPEYMPKKSSRAPRPDAPLAGRASDGQLFAVIPTIGLGAPLAILALLFPSIFGGVFVLFRQWLAFITLISLNSTLLLLYVGLADKLPDNSWWSTPASIWFLMTMCVFACAFWAWRRQLNALSDGEAEAPPKTELFVLAFMAVSCIVTTAVMAYVAAPIRWSDVGWTLTVVMTLGIIAGTLYRGWSAYVKPAPFASMPLATEGVILAAMLLGHVAFVPAIFGGGIRTAGNVQGKAQAGNLAADVAPVKEKWVVPAGENIFGMYASSPLVAGDAVFAAYSDAFQRATMVRFDRQTGMQKWAFKKTYLRQMISSPCLADGKLYFGEGFHDDTECCVYCIDADEGTEIWRFKTGGQTESSPTVANGKLYIGAGNDGLYCFDIRKSLAAKKGVVAWRFPEAGRKTRAAYQERLLRYCGGMIVVGNRLYCGSGVDRNEIKKNKDGGETATFCIDADTGQEIWRTAAPYPVWSTPVIRDGLVYVTSGNGDVLEDVAPPGKPGGAVQCLDAETGQEKWIKKFDNGIINSPAVDAHRIYFGCRDNHIYCLNRADGKQRWSYFLESAVIGTPALDCDPVYGRSLSVFVVTTAGRVCCMQPATGDLIWRYDLKAAVVSTSPQLVVTRTADGYTRRLYFGAGLGGGVLELGDNHPVFYCLEDKVKVE